MIETYSASSLRLLMHDKNEYVKRYKMSLFFRHTTENEKTGNIFHKLIFYHLKGFDVSKMVDNMPEENKIVWENLMKSDILKRDFQFVEQPFLVPVLNKETFFLNGRFDAISKEGDIYIIYDWKSENVPRDAENDIQTVVYLYSLSKLFDTKNIKIRYVSLKKLEVKEVTYDDNINYEKIISDIVQS